MLDSFIARWWFGSQTRLRPLHKALTSGLRLDDLSLAWPAMVQLVVSFNSGSQWILPRVLFFVFSVINLIFISSLWCID